MGCTVVRDADPGDEAGSGRFVFTYGAKAREVFKRAHGRDVSTVEIRSFCLDRAAAVVPSSIREPDPTATLIQSNLTGQETMSERRHLMLRWEPRGSVPHRETGPKR